MIEIERLTKRYDGRAVVQDVSLRLETGSVTAIVGTSGSGKSTLLRMINRLVAPSSGRVRIDGIDTASLPLPSLRRRIGYVIQDIGLFPHWTAARNIATVPSLLGWPKAEVAARVDELLRMFQLDPAEIGPRFPDQLSGGQAQRVGVARALAARPDVLLMDEPFGALDPLIRQRARQDLQAIQQRLGTTVLIVTHDMDEALSLGDRIAVMRAGRIEQFDTPDRLLRAPATPFVRELIGERDRALRLLALLPLGPLLSPGSADGAAISAEASLAEALAAMIWQGRDRLPVHDENDRPLGIVTREAVMAAGRDGPE